MQNHILEEEEERKKKKKGMQKIFFDNINFYLIHFPGHN